MIDEVMISNAIVENFAQFFKKISESQVAIVGAGPAGLCCAYYLAKEGVKTIVIERKLSIGGGIWGGGMFMPFVVVQDEAKEILEIFKIKNWKYADNYHVANSVEMVTKLGSKVIDAGGMILNGISAEDVMIRENNRITGLVINWSAVKMANLHVDPITIKAEVVVDATGHACEICKIIKNKIPDAQLDTPSGDIIGEKPMWAEKGEALLEENTKKVFPGLYVAGMAVNAVMGLPRMGPIFGGMLISGKRAAELIVKELK